MLVPVIYNNSRIDIVDVPRLDDLVRRNSVCSFKRADGWVRIGFDPVRESQKPFLCSEKRGVTPISTATDTDLPTAPDAPAAPAALAAK